MGDCNCLLVTTLEDIAWLLNLRGADVATHPVFKSHLLVEKVSGKIKCNLFVDEE
jgi:Xaa-Pro aminopeptidase